jgi:hypothetical protein
MTTFTTSNGITVDRDANRSVRWINPSEIGLTHMLSLSGAEALHEFFQHERDEELGRWRWPENPDYVVYPLGLDHDGRRFASALHEPSAITGKWQEGQYRVDPPTESNDLGILAVQAYFEAHPEWKPWEDAKPGEVWVLTFDGADDTFKAYESRFGKTYFTRSRETSTDLVDVRITAGRRIWPEDAS